MMTSSDPCVQYLLDRQAILDCVNRYARGLDRHDEAILLSVYHENAVDEHGPFTGNREDFIKWANDFHAEHFVSHTHNIATHNCSIDGDTAHAESYCLYALRRKNNKTVAIGGARYIDKLTKKNGEWRIELRKVYIDWRAEAETSMPGTYPVGVWSRADSSYDRPLKPGKS